MTIAMYEVDTKNENKQRLLPIQSGLLDSLPRYDDRGGLRGLPGNGDVGRGVFRRQSPGMVRPRGSNAGHSRGIIGRCRGRRDDDDEPGRDPRPDQGLGRRRSQPGRRAEGSGFRRPGRPLGRNAPALRGVLGRIRGRIPERPVHPGGTSVLARWMGPGLHEGTVQYFSPRANETGPKYVQRIVYSLMST